MMTRPATTHLRFSTLCTLAACSALAATTQPGSAVTPAPPAKAPVVPPARQADAAKPATAGADFPYQLQSLFGRGDETQAGLRERATGKSHWVAKGDKIGDYTLESVDAVVGLAVLSRNGVRHQLRLAAASAPSTAAAGMQVKTDPVQNKLKEKVLLNDARQLTSALAQYCTENNVKEAELGKLRPWFNGNSLTPGTRITLGDGKDASTFDFSDKAIDRLVLKTGATFALSTEGYDKSISENRRIQPAGKEAKDTPGGASAILFSSDTGSAVE